MSIHGLRGTTTTVTFNTASTSTSSPALPKPLLDTQEAWRRAHLDAQGNPRIERHGDREIEPGRTTVAELPAGSFTDVMNGVRDRPDAGRALVVGDNVGLAVLRYAYGTNKPMEAWLTTRPEGNELKLNVVIAPSCHAGNTPGDKAKNYELFAKTNVYNVEVRYADGSIDAQKFDVRANDVHRGDKPVYEHPVYATLSPDIVINLERAGGRDVVVRGWADGSAGVAGYRERRETIIHL